MKRGWIVGVLSLSLLLFLASGALAQTPKEIRIGVAGPMKAIPGENHWRGATMALDEINKAGGVSLKGAKVPIKLIKIDTNELASVSDAVVAVERAAEDVDFYVGTQRSESTFAMQDVIMKYKKILMGCGAVHPELLLRIAKDYNKYKYYFMCTISSAFQGQVLVGHLEDVAKIVKEQMGIPKPRAPLPMRQSVRWRH